MNVAAMIDLAARETGFSEDDMRKPTRRVSRVRSYVAFALRRCGYKLDDIAVELGYSGPPAVHGAITRVDKLVHMTGSRAFVARLVKVGGGKL